MKLLPFLFGLFLCLSTRADIRISEIFASPSDRQLSWNSNGVPQLGSGIQWMMPDFIEEGWPNGNLPAGYGFGGMATDLNSTMAGRAHTLYLRKEFFLSSTQASFPDPLLLLV